YAVFCLKKKNFQKLIQGSRAPQGIDSVCMANDAPRMNEPPDVVSRYFERDAHRDVEAIVALFSADATVVDEGEARRGKAELRAWQLGAASKYEYETDVLSGEALGADRYLVTGRL